MVVQTLRRQSIRSNCSDYVRPELKYAGKHFIDNLHSALQTFVMIFVSKLSLVQNMGGGGGKKVHHRMPGRFNFSASADLSQSICTQYTIFRIRAISRIFCNQFFVSRVKNNYRRVRFRPKMLRQQIMFSMTIAEQLFDNNNLLTSFYESKQKRLIRTISYNFLGHTKFNE